MKPLSLSTKVQTTSAIVLAVFVALALIYWLFSKPVPVGTASVPATEAPAVKRQPTAKVAIKAPVKVYQGETKANLKLPASMIADDRLQVIAASQVKADLRPQTVSTVVNTETGQVESFVKTDPYPWLAIENRGALSVSYGYKLDATTRDVRQVARLQLGYDVVRVKALTAGVNVSVDTDRQAFIGLGLSYRW